MKRLMILSGTDVVLGAAEMGTGARGEQSEAFGAAGEGLGAAEGDKTSGKKRTRGRQTAGGKRQAAAKRRAADSVSLSAAVNGAALAGRPLLCVHGSKDETGTASAACRRCSVSSYSCRYPLDNGGTAAAAVKPRATGTVPN